MSLYVDLTGEQPVFGTLRKLRPSVSFPKEITPGVLKHVNLYRVVDTLEFDESVDKVVNLDPPYIRESARTYERVGLESLTNEELISSVKSKKKTQVNIILKGKLEGTVEYANNEFQLGAGGRQNMSDTLTVLNDVPNAHGGYWRSVNNKKIQMNSNTAKDLFIRAYAYGATCIRHSHDLKNQIEEANTIIDVNDIDINVGWPNQRIL